MTGHVHPTRTHERDDATPPVPGPVRGSRGNARGRRRAAFTSGDAAALVIGAALALCMLVWFSWRMVQNVAEDRAVAAGEPSAPARGH